MTRRNLILALVISALAFGWVSAGAQTIDSKYFSETGHNVKGEFLSFFNANPNAVFLYGYPITEEFTTKDGMLIQYFQRARFEYHPNQPEGQRVMLSKLGSLTYKPASPVNASNSFSCKKFPETGFSVCFEFLEFFEQYGGVKQFGYPISSFEYHENKLTQYFEFARFGWDAKKPEGKRVIISDIGRFYFHQMNEDQGLLPPVKPINNTASSIISLQAYAFMRKPIAQANDSQTIFIVLQDQNKQPVANASCGVVLHWSKDRAESLSVATNSAGVGSLAFSFADQAYGSLIYADVICSYNNLKAATTSSFRIWY